ncbi:H(+)-transporting V0 sector ATPase subunit a [Nowakowskiella sp. JEL0078]|nr:H(+)-transporting V0 sector ATPase subunit a [Nowakowskiella sp. JEL0078]
MTTMPIFGRGYTWVNEGGKTVGLKKGWTYPIGIDPIWMISENKLMFLNSYKMKMGVIMGFIQMILGLSLTIFNHLHYGKPKNIIAETVPQILFLTSIIGYLVCMIIFKWSVNWQNVGKPAPSLLTTLIYMFLSPGNVSQGDQLFAGQAGLQAFLLLLAFICIPWMLCAKPYLVWYEQRSHLKKGYGNLIENHSAQTSPNSSPSANLLSPSSDTTATSENQNEHTTTEQHDFSEVVIHQIIHTVEFVLNTISHTASYLRLWALSLAHAQLSEVLWDMVLGSVFTLGPGIAPFGLIFAFYMWFYMTVGILLLMEGLSAFLHALRLHW